MTDQSQPQSLSQDLFTNATAEHGGFARASLSALRPAFSSNTDRQVVLARDSRPDIISPTGIDTLYSSGTSYRSTTAPGLHHSNCNYWAQARAGESAAETKSDRRSWCKRAGLPFES